MSVNITTSTSVDFVGLDEALLLQQSVLKIGKPQKGSLEALKFWLNGESEGSRGRTATTFTGLGATRLDDTNDLVALHTHTEQDWLTRLVGLPVLSHFFLVG